MMIEMGKKYVTRDGRPVELYRIDGCLPCPVHGAYRRLDGWSMQTWDKFGKWANGSDTDDLDLIEVMPKTTRTYFVLHWKAGHASAYPEDESLQRYREMMRTKNDPVAITGPHTIEFTEGEGLEPSR